MSLRTLLAICAVLAVVGRPSATRAEPKSEPTAGVPVSVGSVARLDPGLAAIVPATPVIERVASGFIFTEGPVWVRDGFLLFSDIPANRIYKWTPAGALGVYRRDSGGSAADSQGSNGLTLDRTGRLTIAEHGSRRVTRLDGAGQTTALAERYDGKRLNSPNDLVYKSDGALYFTDPPFGLPQRHGDAEKELPFSGIYRIAGGTLQLLTRELVGPNGLAFSPDERVLYVGNWDPQKRVIMRYPLRPDGTLGAGEVWLDVAASVPGSEGVDGLKVDRDGNVYAAAPGGIWILSPSGRHLGTIELPEQPANCAWGDADGRTLYMTARTGLYRARLTIPGIRPDVALQ